MGTSATKVILLSLLRFCVPPKLARFASRFRVWLLEMGGNDIHCLPGSGTEVLLLKSKVTFFLDLKLLNRKKNSFEIKNISQKPKMTSSVYTSLASYEKGIGLSNQLTQFILNKKSVNNQTHEIKFKRIILV